MLILGVSGTPREHGNSEILLDYSLRPFRESGWSIQTIFLSRKSVAPCIGCDKCLTYGRCWIDDDMNEVIEAFRNCDALIVSTPVYYRTPSAQLLSLFQRHYSIQNEQPLQGKPGGAIAVGRGTAGGQAISISIIYNWMLSCGMFCVPGKLNGVTASANAPGDILQQEHRLTQAIQLGENIKNLAETIQRGRQ